MTHSMLIRGIGVLAELIVEDGDQGPERDAELVSELRRLWSRCLVSPESLKPDDEPETRVRLALRSTACSRTTSVDGNAHTVQGPDIEWLLTSTTQVITRALIAQRIGRRLLLHAGCVAHPTTGRALVFVAAGGTGKTTLATGLASHYSYVTDETVSISTNGAIDPYPKPLSVVGAGHYHKAECSPEELGLQPVGADPVLVKLVLLHRDSSIDGIEVEDLPLLDAIEEIVPQSSSIHRLPQPLHAIAAVIDLADGVQRWTYSEWETLQPLVADTLGAI